MKDIREEVRQDWERIVEVRAQMYLDELREHAQASGLHPMTHDECRAKYGGVLALPRKEDNVYLLPSLDRHETHRPDYSALRGFGNGYHYSDLNTLMMELWKFIDEHPRLFETLRQRISKDYRREYLKSIKLYLEKVSSCAEVLSGLINNKVLFRPSKLTSPLAKAAKDLTEGVRYAKEMKLYLEYLDSIEVTKRKSNRKTMTSIPEWNHLILEVMSFFERYHGAHPKLCATKTAELFKIVFPSYWTDTVEKLTNRISSRVNTLKYPLK